MFRGGCGRLSGLGDPLGLPASSSTMQLAPPAEEGPAACRGCGAPVASRNRPLSSLHWGSRDSFTLLSLDSGRERKIGTQADSAVRGGRPGTTGVRRPAAPSWSTRDRQLEQRTHGIRLSGSTARVPARPPCFWLNETRTTGSAGSSRWRNLFSGGSFLSFPGRGREQSGPPPWLGRGRIVPAAGVGPCSCQDALWGVRSVSASFGKVSPPLRPPRDGAPKDCQRAGLRPRLAS